MSLELDGKPFELSDAQLTKYSRKFVFRVGKQHIKLNRDPEASHQIETGAVHIMPQYQHDVMNGTNRTPKGTLVYFTSKQWFEERKKFEYEPARIAIDYHGYIESVDPELNFFLDNHPSNEEVKRDDKHPNYSPTASTYFSTYKRERIRDVNVNLQKLTAELTMKIHSKSDTTKEEIKAIAQAVVKTAPDYKIAHRLHSVDDLEDIDIRAELARLSAIYPNAISEIIASNNVNYYEMVNKLVDNGMIKMVGQEWVEMNGNKPGAAIMKIPTNADGMKALIDWFKNFDSKGAKFRKLKEKMAERELSLKKEPVE